MCTAFTQTNWEWMTALKPEDKKKLKIQSKKKKKFHWHVIKKAVKTLGLCECMRSRPQAHVRPEVCWEGQDSPERTAAPFPSAPADRAPAQSSGTTTWVDSAAPSESPRANSLFKQNTGQGHQETNQPSLIYSFKWPIQIPYVDRKVT